MPIKVTQVACFKMHPNFRSIKNKNVHLRRTYKTCWVDCHKITLNKRSDVLQIHQFPCLFSSNLNHYYIKPTFITISLALFETQTSFFFRYQYVFIHCVLPRKRKGREKGQSVFYKMIVNGKGSNLAQQNQPSNKYCPHGATKA